MLCPSVLINSAIKFWSRHVADSLAEAERTIKVYIDEAQMLFNSRAWTKKGNQEWAKFFSVHRHFGYEIILMSQNDFNLDKQVRGVIEYNYVHRKVENSGIVGNLLSKICGGLFFYKSIWVPQNEVVDHQFFRYKKEYGELYDTSAMFSIKGLSKGIIRYKK